MIFIDLDKTFDRVPRNCIQYALRKKEVAECMVKVVMDMYEAACAVVVDDGIRSRQFKFEFSVVAIIVYLCDGCV